MSFEEWDKEVETYGGIPEGKYQAEITSCVFKPGKNGLAPELVWTMTIVGGGNDMVGEQITHSRRMGKPEHREWAWKDLLSCGLRPATWSEAIDQLSLLNGTVMEISAKSSGKYTNIYLNDVVKTLARGEEVPF